jgi:hypothetical protein
LTGGDLIRTNTTVEAHVYDIDYSTTWDWRPWQVQLDIGARIANIEQRYESTVTLAGVPVATGTFAADFRGAGPQVGLEAKRSLSSRRPLCVFASTNVALLVGEHDVSSANSFGGGAFVAGQATSQRRTIPVLETELGATWQITDSFELSAGWLFHAWHDLGASGGTFGGFFVGSDDANTMSFDGLLLRAMYLR